MIEYSIIEDIKNPIYKKLSQTCQVINMNMVSNGTINASVIIPRKVFKSSILVNASAVIGLHNHPCGNVKPLKEDMIYDSYEKI